MRYGADNTGIIFVLRKSIVIGKYSGQGALSQCERNRLPLDGL